MICCLQEMYNKNVINVEDGTEIGVVCDIEVDTCSGKVASIKVQLCGGTMFKKAEIITVPWDDIVVVGSAAVLVKNVKIPPRKKESNSFLNFFSK